jgi:arylsulfatase A-like enzyme
MEHLLMRILSLAPALLGSAIAHAAFAQQNVLVIVADDLGVRNVGAYVNGDPSVEGTPPPTPNIDAIAAAGVRYTGCWANPVCSPMRASFLTGRYPARHGIGNVVGAANGPELEESEITLAEALAPAGVATALVGKWHLDANPPSPDAANRAGFGYFAGSLQGALPSYFQWPKVVQGEQAISTVYATTDCVNEARDFIKGSAGPWMCVVAFNAPHTPFHMPPAELITAVPDGTPASNPNGHYRAMIEAMDTEIGRLFRETRGGLPALLQDTWVIFVADNGTPPAAADPPLEPIGRIKGTCFEGGIKVPLIVAGPGVVSPGRVRPDLVSVVDLFPTVGDMMGIDVRAAVPSDRAFDGVSFIRSLRQPWSPVMRTTVYSEQFQADPWATGQSAVRNVRFKLIRTVNVFQMFDLVTDPDESIDLLSGGIGSLTPPQRSAFETLRAEMFAIVPPPQCPCDLDEDFDADTDDLRAYLARWPAGAGDFNGDGAQDRADLRAFLQCMRTCR